MSSSSLAGWMSMQQHRHATGLRGVLFWLRQLLLLAMFEWRRVFGNKKAWLVLLALVLVWGTLFWQVLLPLSVKLQDPTLRLMAYQGLAQLGLANLSAWRLPEVAMFWLLCCSVWPVASMLLTASQTCRDRQQGTLRFLLLRTTRSQLFFGRFFGHWLLMGWLMLAVNILFLTMLALQYQHIPWAAASQMPQLWCNAMLMMLPFVSLMALCSVWAKSSRVALAMAICGVAVLAVAISQLRHLWPDAVELLTWLPGARLDQWLEIAAQPTVELWSVSALQTIAFLLLGWFSMHRRAI